MALIRLALKYMMLFISVLLMHRTVEGQCMYEGMVDRLEDHGQTVILLEKEKREVILPIEKYLVEEGDLLVIDCEEVERYGTKGVE